MNIDLSTGTPASPERTLHLAETAAEIFRCLNHATLDSAAFGYPDGTDRVLREIGTAVSRIPQLLSQIARWNALEDAAGRIGVTSGEWAGRPHTAVTALQDRLDTARATAEALAADLKYAAHVTSDMTAREVDGGE